MSTIRNQLEARIRVAGISNVAEATGISQSTLSEWLNQKRGRRLGDRQVDAIADYLKLSVTLTQQQVPHALPDTEKG